MSRDRTWKCIWCLGRWFSFSSGAFSGSMLSFWRVFPVFGGLVSSAQFFRNCYDHCNVATPCWHFAVIFFGGAGGVVQLIGKYILENFHGTQKWRLEDAIPFVTWWFLGSQPLLILFRGVFFEVRSCYFFLVSFHCSHLNPNSSKIIYIIIPCEFGDVWNPP